MRSNVLSRSHNRSPAASEALRPNAKDKTATATSAKSRAVEALWASSEMPDGSAQTRGAGGAHMRLAARVKSHAFCGGACGESPILKRKVQAPRTVLMDETDCPWRTMSAQQCRTASSQVSRLGWEVAAWHMRSMPHK